MMTSQVVRSVNGYLAPLSETYNSSFLGELWQSIEDVVKVRTACEKKGVSGAVGTSVNMFPFVWPACRPF
jgi:hypothetical protein